MKTLLIDPFNGASGDMLLAALVDAGCPVEDIRAGLVAVPELSRVTVDVTRVTRGPFAGAQMVIGLPGDQSHRGLAEVSRIIRSAPRLAGTSGKTTPVPMS